MSKSGAVLAGVNLTDLIVNRVLTVTEARTMTIREVRKIYVAWRASQ